MKYRISYYGPDGTGGSLPDEAYPAIHGQECRTLAIARAYIRDAVGGRMFGRWNGEPEDDDPGSLWETVEAWHESRDEGCGGYAIEQRRA